MNSPVVEANNGTGLQATKVPENVADPLIGKSDGFIGMPLSRLDGPAKVTGKVRYAAEFAYEGMLYASLAFSTIARGRIVSLECGAAEAAPGVALVMTHRNAPRMKPMPAFLTAPKAMGADDLPIMQDDLVHWNGQPIAVVLAETQEQADYASSLIVTTYQCEQAVTSLSAGSASGVEQGSFGGQPLKNEIGDAEAAVTASDFSVDVAYTTPRHNHNAIEPHAATVTWKDDTLIVHDASQAVSHAAWSLATILGIDETKVEVTAPFVGGGFGGKCLWQHQVLAAAASKLSGRPVRLSLSREGVYRLVGGRTLTEQRVAIGADGAGHFEALIHTGTVAISRHNALAEPFILPAQTSYASPNIKLNVGVVRLDMLANTFMRAPGEAVGSFGLECAVDELAVKLKIDPIELRILNEPKTDPTSGLPFSSRQAVLAWRMGAERFGWSQRNSQPAQRREGEWLIGTGCATAGYPYHRMPGGRARITLHKTGRVDVEVAAHDMGMGTATAQTQVIADRLGLRLDQVRFSYGSSTIPGKILAGGSQQTASIGAAVIAASRELRSELIRLAGPHSPLADLSADEVRGVDGGLGRLDSVKRIETYTEILERADRETLVVEVDGPALTEMTQWSIHSLGAMFCEVRVSSVTGETRVSRFLGSFDCGRILNPKMAISQFKGGIVMGLGLALMEETLADERNGRIMNPRLSDYHVPVHMDIPDIDVIWTDIPDPYTPMGARGIGEIGITGTAAAVANAVYNATGKRVRTLPITLDKLL